MLHLDRDFRSESNVVYLEIVYEIEDEWLYPSIWALNPYEDQLWGTLKFKESCLAVLTVKETLKNSKRWEETRLKKYRTKKWCVTHMLYNSFLYILLKYLFGISMISRNVSLNAMILLSSVYSLIYWSKPWQHDAVN